MNILFLIIGFICGGIAVPIFALLFLFRNCGKSVDEFIKNAKIEIND